MAEKGQMMYCNESTTKQTLLLFVKINILFFAVLLAVAVVVGFVAIQK